MNKDKPLGAGLIAIGIAGIIMAMQISVKTFNDDPGPKLFPIFAFAILIFCGLGMLLVGKPGQPNDHISDLTAEEKHVRFVRGSIMCGLFILFSLGLWLFGFYLTTPVMIYAFYHVIAGPGRRIFWRGAVYALSVTGGVHLVFAVFLHTLLPVGSLF